MKRILLWVLFWTGLASAQVVSPGFVDYVTSAPSGMCSQGAHQQNVLGSGNIYTCQSGTWAKAGGSGGSGTVTSIATTAPITGGTITTTGTIACATCVRTDPTANQSIVGNFALNIGTLAGTDQASIQISGNGINPTDITGGGANPTLLYLDSVQNSPWDIVIHNISQPATDFATFFLDTNNGFTISSTRTASTTSIAVRPLITQIDLNTGSAVSAALNSTGFIVTGGTLNSPKYQTSTNCAVIGTAANPSVASCAAAAAGAFSCATNASAATCTVNTTAVTANSRIIVQESAAEGANLSVTCNTAPTVTPAILLASRIAATSFTINMPTITVNPACFVYWVVN